MQQPTVSFCLVACDEQPRLEACLASVAPLCDELVVVDTGSSDGTVALARQLGARVVHFEWVDDFSAARNFGLEHLGGDWVLMLDADEQLMPQAMAPIRQLICQTDTLVVNLLRREVGATQSPLSLVSRLFRRHPGIRFDRPYHGMIDDSVEALLKAETGWNIRDLGVPAIAHTGYRPGEIAGRDKAERAKRAMSRYHAQHPDDPYVCSKLGALLFSMGETTRALELLHNGLKAADDPAVSGHVRYELHYHLGLLHQRSQRPDAAREHYGKAMRQGVDPLLAVGAAFNLATLDHEQGLFQEAVGQFGRIVDLVPDLPQAHMNLGLGLKAMGEIGRAERHYRKAIELEPEYADAHRNLGVLLLRAGRSGDALDCFATALACYDRQSPEEAGLFRRKLVESGLLAG